MFLEKLEENYTKVSYVKYNRPILENITTSTKFKKSVERIMPIVLLSGVIYFNMNDIALANSFTDRAEDFYYKTFMTLAKWVIIIKGGWDIISKTLREDFEGAKKSVVQYMVVFAVLMGLPHALDLVEDFFSGEV